jgi:CRISPR-associated exonuclease Cas4
LKKLGFMALTCLQNYDEEDFLPISALQHFVFCERQWALIHLEQLWVENRLTAEGRQLHERVDEQGSESRRDVRIARSLRLRSLKLGLSGIADVVEFQFREKNIWAYPIEYKRGRPKNDLADSIQICAQAFCLEEMLQTRIDRGALFYGKPNKRFEVQFDDFLRNETLQLIQNLHRMTKERKTPPARFEKKCQHCSLVDLCMPSTTNGTKKVDRYLDKISIWSQEDC